MTQFLSSCSSDSEVRRQSPTPPSKHDISLSQNHHWNYTTESITLCWNTLKKKKKLFYLVLFSWLDLDLVLDAEVPASPDHVGMSYFDFVSLRTPSFLEQSPILSLPETNVSGSVCPQCCQQQSLSNRYRETRVSVGEIDERFFKNAKHLTVVHISIELYLQKVALFWLLFFRSKDL